MSIISVYKLLDALEKGETTISQAKNVLRALDESEIKFN